MTRSAGVLTPRKPPEAVASMAARVNGDPESADGTANARGTVTAEFAVALPAVLGLLAILLAGAAAGMTQLRIEEGARAGARALARGEDPAMVERTVRTLAGGSATASVAADGGWFNVTVTDRVSGPLGSSIPWTLTARASTLSETAGTASTSGRAGLPASKGRG